jgi:MFS family permease
MTKIVSEYPQLRPLWIAVFVDILGFTIILPFLPIFAEKYNPTPLLLGLLMASNAIFGFFFSTILGKLSDKYGRKPLLLISQAGTTATINFPSGNYSYY